MERLFFCFKFFRDFKSRNSFLLQCCEVYCDDWFSLNLVGFIMICYS